VVAASLVDSLISDQAAGIKAVASYCARRAAEQIVRQTAPFPLFPAELEKQTSRLKLIINRRFERSRNLVPERSTPRKGTGTWLVTTPRSRDSSVRSKLKKNLAMIGE
jgi:hypothetical protein